MRFLARSDPQTHTGRALYTEAFSLRVDYRLQRRRVKVAGAPQGGDL